MNDAAPNESPIQPGVAYRRSTLLKIYRAHAASQGWNTHPMAVEQRVDLWLSHGIGPVDEAIASHKHRSLRRLALREHVAIAITLSAGTVAAVALFWMR